MLDERKSWSYYYEKALDRLYTKNRVFILDKNLLRIDTKEDMSDIVRKPLRYFSNYNSEEKHYKYYSFINEDVFSHKKDMMKYLEEDFVIDLDEFQAFSYKLKRAFVFYFPHTANSLNPYKESKKFRTLTSPDWKWTAVVIGVRLNGDISLSNKVFKFKDKKNTIENLLISIGNKTLYNNTIKGFDKTFVFDELLYSKVNKSGGTSEKVKELFYLFLDTIKKGYIYNIKNFYSDVIKLKFTHSHNLYEFHLFKGNEYKISRNFNSSIKRKKIESFFIKLSSEIKKSLPADVKNAVNKTGHYDIILYQWINNGFKKSRKYRLQAIESFPSFYTTLIKHEKSIDSGASITNLLAEEFNVSKNLIKKLNGYSNKKTKGLFNDINKIGPEVYLKVIKDFSIKVETKEDFKYLYIFVNFLKTMINLREYDEFYHNITDNNKYYENDICEIIDIMKKKPINNVKEYCLNLGFEHAFSVSDKKILFVDGIKLIVKNLLLPYIIHENDTFNDVYSITETDIETYISIYANKYIKRLLHNSTLEELLEYGIILDKKLSKVEFMNSLYYDDPKHPIIENISEESSELYSRYNKDYWPGLIRYTYFDEETNIEIVPIKTIHELKEEGRVMDHCVGTTRNKLCYKGESFIFSFRQNGEHIATLDLFMHKGENGKRSYNDAYTNNNKIFINDKENDIKIINVEFRGYDNIPVSDNAMKAYLNFQKVIKEGEIKIDYEFLFGHSYYIKRVMDIAPLFETINFNPHSEEAQYAIKRKFDEFLSKKERKMHPLEFQKSILL